MRPTRSPRLRLPGFPGHRPSSVPGEPPLWPNLSATDIGDAYVWATREAAERWLRQGIERRYPRKWTSTIDKMVATAVEKRVVPLAEGAA